MLNDIALMTLLDGGAGRACLAWAEPTIINTIAIEIQKRHSLFNLFKLTPQQAKPV
jgi:hypothetical protein